MSLNQSGKRNLSSSDAAEFQLATVYNHWKTLHPALGGNPSPGIALPHSTHDLEFKYLRNLSLKLIPSILPRGTGDADSKLLCALLADIITAYIWLPIVQLLSDPDYWNQTIVNLGESLLEEQKMVKRMREVLDSVKDEDWQELESLEKNLDSSLSSKKLASAYNSESRNNKRLTIRVNSSLSNRGSASPNISQNNLLLSPVTDVETGSTGLQNKVSRMFSLSRKKSDNLLKNDNSTCDIEPLFVIPGVSFWREFLDKEGCLSLLQFWLTVDVIRPDSQIKNSDHSSTKDFTNSEVLKKDLISIYHNYLNETTMMPSMSSEITKREVKVRDLISPDLLKLLSNNFKQLESSSENTEVLTSCLEEIIHISNNIQLYMRKRLIPIFIKSNEYKQMINDAQFSSKYPSFSLSNFKREKWSPVKKKANQIFDLIRGSGRNASNILIHGLNSASGAFANSSDLKYNRSSSFDNVSSESILNEDVGSINESFDEIRHSSESLDTNDNHRKSGLFEEVQNRFRTILKEESDTLLPPIADTSTPDLPIENLNPFDETSSEKMNSDVSPVIAVNGEEAVAVDPPFLNSEDFQKNDEAAIMLELENVKKQLVGVSQKETLLDLLIANSMKSFESTSSTPFTSRLGKSSDKSRELKLLKKMRAQVEEEKKTWLMEQSRLSLQLTGAGIAPGRTQVRIVSCTRGKGGGDKQKPFVIFLIHVDPCIHGNASKEENTVSGWMVARRYSEFNAMHRTLKSLFSERMKSESYKLPGKKILHQFSGRLLNPFTTNMNSSSNSLVSSKEESSADEREREFMESRRVELEKYLRTLILDPVIANSEPFKNFLTRDYFNQNMVLSLNMLNRQRIETSGIKKVGKMIGGGIIAAMDKIHRTLVDTDVSDNEDEDYLEVESDKTKDLADAVKNWNKPKTDSLLSFSTSSNDSDLIQKQIKETISTPMDIVESSRSLSVPLKSPVEQLLIHGVPVDPERALKISGIAVEAAKSALDRSQLQHTSPTSSGGSLTEPLCDLFIELFELKEKNNWLRRQAVSIILQQVLGGTIERRISDTLKWLYSEDMICWYVELLVDLIQGNDDAKPSNSSNPSSSKSSSDSVPLPTSGRKLVKNAPVNNSQKSPPPARTAEQKFKTKQEAYRVMDFLIPDILGSMVGKSNARRGASRLFDVLQNRRLNQELIYRLLDEIIVSLFPEVILPK